MKVSDIQRIRDAGLISDAQCRSIVAHFRLDQEGNRFLFILAIFGGLLVSAGVILLVAANWEAIPRAVKLVTGVVLLVATHGAGWYWGRGGEHGRPVLAEALYLVGAGLFLANIALVGQTYHLSSRSPNGILLWWIGIAPLAWILRSRLQYVLLLSAIVLWLGLELNEPGGWIYFRGEARQSMFYLLVGVAAAAAGPLYLGTRYPEFAGPTEKLGLLFIHLASFPLTVGFFYGSGLVTTAGWVLCGIVTVASLVAVGWTTGRDAAVGGNRQWGWVWAGCLGGILALAWSGLLVEHRSRWSSLRVDVGFHWVAIPALFAFCLIQARVGVLRSSRFMVNLAVAFMGLHMISAYIQLFGSMANTGLMFLLAGVGLISMAVVLERKRRSLIRQMALPAPSPTPP